jgi:hypothetical protein
MLELVQYNNDSKTNSKGALDMKEKLVAAGYKASQTGRHKTNPRCVCCNLPVAECKWVAADAKAALAKRQSTWARPKGVR